MQQTTENQATKILTTFYCGAGCGRPSSGGSWYSLLSFTLYCDIYTPINRIPTEYWNIKMFAKMLIKVLEH